jgi:hypothetical protein
MEEAEKYLNTIRKALKNWDKWIENGNQILTDGDKQLLMGWIEFETKKLLKLDVKKVKEEILQNEEGIEFRLKRLDTDFKLLPTIEYINDTRNTPAALSDEEANEEINAYRKKIEEKALDLIRVYDECKKYIKPQNPIMTKAMADPVLLRIFYENKKNLEEYIKYCLGDTNVTQKAIMAKEYAVLHKLRCDEDKTPLHGALQRIGLNVGSIKTWTEAINKY